MNTLDGNPPIARNELMRSNPNNTRGRFASFGSPQTGPHRLLGNELSPPPAQSFVVLLPKYKELMAMPLGRRTRVKVDLISNGRTVPKLKLISQFADMGTNRAQAVFHENFYQSPKLMGFVARRGYAR
ncbi:MAG: hypothetical protein HZB87_03610 [Desulfatitalea sp.]|nr:hypothetical protein [Desulfatitalea sp.]